MTTDDQRDQDIADLFKSESSRGTRKGQIDREAKSKGLQLQRDILKALHDKDERKFSEMLRKAGVKDGDERWANAWKLYRAYWGQS